MLGERSQLPLDPGAQRRLALPQRRDQRRAEGRPERGRGLQQLRVVKHADFDPFGPLHRLRVVLEVIGELGEQVVQGDPSMVVRVVADVLDPGERFDVQSLDDHLVDPRRRPPRGAFLEDRREGLLVGEQPPVGFAHREVDQPVVRAVAHHFAEEGAGDGRDRLLAQSRQHRLVQQPGHRCVAEPVERGDRHADDLVGGPKGVGRHEGPGRGPRRDVGGQNPVADDLLPQEVVTHEVLQAPGQHVLLLGDERGVRDRQTHRVPEQRRHREPVGDRADHRCLGAGVDEPPGAVFAQGEDIDDRGEQQQTQRYGAHLPQPSTALLVAHRVGHDAHTRHECPFYRPVNRAPSHNRPDTTLTRPRRRRDRAPSRGS